MINESLCYARLPFAGRLVRVAGTGGFGFVTNISSGEVFIHQKSRFCPTERALPDASNQLIFFALGSRPAREKRDGTLWCFADDVEWGRLGPCCSEVEHAERRKQYFSGLDIRRLVKMLSANWYREIWANDQNLPADLEDPDLQHAIVVALDELRASDEDFARIIGAFEKSPYDFTYQWMYGHEFRVARSLLSKLPPEKLALIRTPDFSWLEQALPEQIPKLVEWALRCADVSARWRSLLEPSHSWDQEVACRLLQSDGRPVEFIVDWIKQLVAQGQLDSRLCIERLGRFPEEEAYWGACLSVSDRIDQLSMALDIESDGEHIWQIGVADASGRQLLFDEARPDSDSAAALLKLSGKIKARALVIGHNIIDWDWPILTRNGLALHEQRFVLWDTLLVQFMLEPWAASHALRGSHKADEDSQATLTLFKEQVRILGDELASRIIKREFVDSTTLFAAISNRLECLSWNVSQPPHWLSDAMQAVAPSGQAIVAPAGLIRTLGWLKDFHVGNVSHASGSDKAFMEIDIDAFMGELGDLPRGPAGIAVRAVLRKARQEHIAVRYGIIPLWLRQKPEVSGALESSLRVVKPTAGTVFVSPYPDELAWYSSEDARECLFVDLPEQALIGDMTLRRVAELPAPLQAIGPSQLEAPRSASLYWWQGPGDVSGVLEWAQFDPTAGRIGGVADSAWRTFGTLPVKDLRLQTAVLSRAKATAKPRLVTWESVSLYPGAEDQGNYWQGVLERLFAITDLAEAEDSVPLLLATSTRTRELLQLLKAALVAISRAPVLQDCHTASECLVRTGRLPGGCLVDFIDSFPRWSELAAIAGVRLMPVVESLPLNEWWAVANAGRTAGDICESDAVDAADADAAPDADDAGSTVEDDSSIVVAAPTNAATRVKPSQVLNSAGLLVSANLDHWLSATLLTESRKPIFVIDPRLKPGYPEIRNRFEAVKGPHYLLDDTQRDAIKIALEPLFGIRREEASSEYEPLRQFLQKHWRDGNGQPILDFRENQRSAVDLIRTRKADVLVTLPTGAGKSVLFQAPALYRGLKTRRLSLVISPLRALMQDQVQNLEKLGFHQSVDFLSADRPIHDVEDVFQGVLDHRIVLLYIAPERFRNRRFLDLLDRRLQSDGCFEYLVIDETHCVSQWGYDFRPDYFHAIKMIRDKYRINQGNNKSPYILLSATVTARTRDDLERLTSGSSVQGEEPYLPLVPCPDQYFPPVREHIHIDPQSVPGQIRGSRNDWQLEPRLDKIKNIIAAALKVKAQKKQVSGIIVFVSRRDHAEEVAFLLGRESSGRVDYFHAGLDAEVRTEVYERFKKDQIDVLVATKAFGMGMDIPHIHWAIHLSPPSFLEDYLQEVGRIGRGEQERKGVGLGKLKAVLLYSDDDFESNRANIERSRIDLIQLQDFFGELSKDAKQVDDTSVVLLPEAGYKSFPTESARRSGATQIRKMLFWLERMKRVEIAGMMPSLLPIHLMNPELLRTMAASEEGDLAAVALCLRSLIEPQQPEFVPAWNDVREAPAAYEPGVVERLMKRLSSYVGFLFGDAPKQSATGEPVARATPGEVQRAAAVEPLQDAVVNLGHIWREARLRSMDDVLSTLVDLEKRGAVSIQRSLMFNRSRLFSAQSQQITALFEFVETVAKEIARRADGHGNRSLDFAEIATNYPEVRLDGELVEVRPQMERAVCYLLRGCGVSIRERIVDNEQVERTTTLSRGQSQVVRSRIKQTVGVASRVWKVLNKSLELENRQIAISELVTAARDRQKSFRQSELRRALGLLGSMRLARMSGPLLPMSYVITVNSKDKIARGGNEEVLDELADVNRMAELRCLVTEIYAHLPSDTRDDFIKGYFSQRASAEMASFLSEQVTLTGDDGFIQTILKKISAEGVSEHFRRYRELAEEPNQWKAIEHPFDKHLLVNAGPGSGKTAVLIARVVHLIREQRLRPEEILVLAFNRAVVYEIRSRVRALFRELGYGAYVRRLKVFTFHAAAMLHLEAPDETEDRDSQRKDLLKRFADMLESGGRIEVQFVQEVRTILVDEFQDANDDIFRIINHLHRRAVAGTGVMVIGDDDQDIQRWNRSGARRASEYYFEKFVSGFNVKDDTYLMLSVNFRSAQVIVDSSQQRLQEFFERRKSDITVRLKTGWLRPSKSNAHEAVRHEVANNPQFGATQRISEMVLQKAEACLQDASKNNESVAILCRSNAEVAEAYDRLQPHDPAITIQNNVRYPVAWLRHIAVWLDICRDAEAARDRPLSDASLEEYVREMYGACNIPEVKAPPQAGDVSADELWQMCLKEHSYPHLSHLIDFVENLDTDDTLRLRGGENFASRCLISTIHKVKGLEFDRVIVVPSTTAFPFSSSERREFIANAHQHWDRPLSEDEFFDLDAAEEARLWYVAMTRAKRHLISGLGEREQAWFSRESFEALGQQYSNMLTGSPKEVVISWAGHHTRYPGVFSYIESAVSVGDPMRVGEEGALLHERNGRNRRIGRLRDQPEPKAQDKLRVAAVIRYPQNMEMPYFREYPERFAALAEPIRRQGWTYVVLVSGSL